MPIGAGTALLGGAALSAGGSLLSGIMGSNAASSAAKVQANAASNAANIQGQEYLMTRNDLAPYRDAGAAVLPDYLNRIGNFQGPNALAPPPSFDNQSWGLGADQQAALEATPGYQFTKTQGLRAVQNSAAAQGRGISGNALAGAANYATGLASTTFNQQFQNALTGQNQNFSQTLTGQGQRYGQELNNMLLPISLRQNALSLGENAAAQTGNFGQQAATNAGNLLTSGAAATAGGIVGSTNALTSGIGGIGNSASNLSILNLLTGGKIFGTGAGLTNTQMQQYGISPGSSNPYYTTPG